MAEMTLTKTRIHAGTYEGVLKASAGSSPKIAAQFGDTALDGVTTTPDSLLDDTWHVRLSVPGDVLADGIQTFILSDAATGDRLDSFTIITGAPLDEDLRGEVDLLRAELDMLKKAFRRHCVETS